MWAMLSPYSKCVKSYYWKLEIFIDVFTLCSVTQQMCLMLMIPIDSVNLHLYKRFLSSRSRFKGLPPKDAT